MMTERSIRADRARPLCDRNLMVACVSYLFVAEDRGTSTGLGQGNKQLSQVMRPKAQYSTRTHRFAQIAGT